MYDLYCRDHVAPNILKVECGLEEELVKADQRITHPRKPSLGQGLLSGLSSALLSAGSNSGSTRGNAIKEKELMSPDRKKSVLSVGILNELASTDPSVSIS